MPERKLGYRLPLQCVAHEVAPGAPPRDAETVVDGYSLCLPCTKPVVEARLRGYGMTEILGEVLSGDWEVVS